MGYGGPLLHGSQRDPTRGETPEISEGETPALVYAQLPPTSLMAPAIRGCPSVRLQAPRDGYRAGLQLKSSDVSTYLKATNVSGY